MTMLRLEHPEEVGPFFETVLRTLGLAVALFGAMLTVRPIDRTIA